MKKQNCYLFLILLVGTFIKVDAQTWNWANSLGGAQSDFIIAMQTDPADGSIVVTGNVLDSAFVCTDLVLPTADRNMFVAKYDSNGNCEWTANEHSGGYTRGDGVAIDDAGNIYVCGLMIDSFRVGTTTLLSYGGADAFLVKYSSAGHLIWAKALGGKGSDIAYDIRFHQGKLFLAGQTSDTATFQNLQLTGEPNNIFIARLDTSGHFEAIRSFGGPGYDRAYQIGFGSSNEIKLIGYYTDSLQMDTIHLTSNGSKDIFLATLDANFNCLSVSGWGGSSSGDEPFNLTTDDLSGNTYVTFHYNENCLIGTDSLAAAPGNNEGIVCFNQNNSAQWYKTVTSPNSLYISTVETDGNGNIWYAAELDSMSTFDAQNLDGKDGSILLTRIDANGNLLSDTLINFAGEEKIWGMDFHAGVLNVFGVFTQSLGLAGSSQSAGKYDGFVAQVQSNPLGILSEKEADTWELFPVPANDFLEIHTSEKLFSAYYSIVNIEGRMMKYGELNIPNGRIDISNLPSGLYFFKSGNRVLKFIKT